MLQGRYRELTMSSDSDLDEFYDASDVTPSKPDQVHAPPLVNASAVITPAWENPGMARTPSVESAEIDAQEEQLLQQMKLIEERRRQEKLEVELKIARLQQRKLEEQERRRLKAEADQVASLRSKLHGLRGQLEEETSPPPTDKPARTLPATDESSADYVTGHSDSSTTISREESTEKCLPYCGYISTSSSSSDNLPLSCSGGSGDGAQKSRVVRGEIKVEMHSDNVTGADTPEELSEEPDLIRSTKPQDDVKLSPLAPPRRKKRPAPLPPHLLPGTSSQRAKDLGKMLEILEVPKGLPMVPTPSSTVNTLTRDLEQSLDLFSATCLTNHVLAIESGATGMAAEDDTGFDRVKVTNGQRASTLPLDPKFVFVDQNGRRVSQKRPRSNSGSRFLTDKEILAKITVMNLDTGEKLPLNDAEEKLPNGINPLSLHIMRRLHKNRQSDEESVLSKSLSGSRETVVTINTISPAPKSNITKRQRFRKFFGRTKDRVKSGAAKAKRHHDNKDSSEEEVDDPSLDSRRMIKIKASSHHKGPYDFDLLVPVQELGTEKKGAVWTMKFSQCGRLLATGGQDNLLRVYVLRSAYSYFDDMRQRYSEKATRVSPAPSQESLNSVSGSSDTTSLSEEPPEELAAGGLDDSDDEHAPFIRRPFFVYKGHTADVLDLSWSKNYFILTSSMDKTVRLWHVSRRECLCSFQHIDFVTAIAFHPKVRYFVTAYDDRYFLSGSLDGKLRLWNIPDKRVALWNEVAGTGKPLITTANFCLQGRFAVVGTYDGRCVFYSTEQLKYYTQIHVRSTRGRNSRGRKITGIEPYPGSGDDKILVTSNDSRIRMYDLRDLTLTCKYKGCTNNSSQIKAVFSSNGRYIICGSEDHFVYIWRTQHENFKLTSARRDRNDFWEGIKAHTAVVTAAIFAPQPSLIIRPQFDQVDPEEDAGSVRGEVLLSADFTGLIRVFINKFKPGSG